MSEVKSKRSPGRTPEDREDRLISMAIDLAEKQILEGTASSQVITHFLKLGSTKERLEKQILQNQNELLKAKTSAIRSGESYKETVDNAIKAFSTYSGNSLDDYEDI